MMPRAAASRLGKFTPACIGAPSPRGNPQSAVRVLFAVVFALLLGVIAHAAPLDDANQLVVSTAPAWGSSQGRAQRFERRDGEWRAVGAPWAVLFGKNGLAWGRGVLSEAGGLQKVERDGRAPAGVFKIGTVYTYDQALPPGSDFPFHTVTAADAWVDDPTLPEYNRHVRIDPAAPPAWFAKQRMRLGDFAYRWLVEIRHNSDPPAPGHGSAIFFHIRRGPTKPSAGCTTMAESDLKTLIRWLRAPARPHYALLPEEEYLKKWRAWGLPPPSVAVGLLPIF